MNSFLKISGFIFLVLFFTACAQDKNNAVIETNTCAAEKQDAIVISNYSRFNCADYVASNYKVIAIFGGDSAIQDSNEYKNHLSTLISESRSRADFVIYFSDLEGQASPQQYSDAVEVMLLNKVPTYDTYSVGIARKIPVSEYINQVIQEYRNK